jgi:hypothetical protein
MNLSDLENGNDVAAVLESIDLASLLADAARLILGPAMSIQAPPNLWKTTHRVARLPQW